MSAAAVPWQAILPPPLYALVDSAQPVAARLPAARGLAPLPPRDLVAVLAALSCDSVEELQAAAQLTLAKLPEGLLLPIVSGGDTPPAVLAALLAPLSGRPALLEQLVANRATPDGALAEWAPAAPAAQAEMLAADQQRCLRCEPLVRALCCNAQVLHSSLDRLFDFLVRSGVMYADMPQVGEAIARLGGAELHAATAAVALPADVVELLGEDPPESAPEPTASAAALAVAAAATESVEAAATADADADAGAEAPQRVPILKRVNAMNMAQKVALATRGNKEARAILLRDANRVVAVAAIKNPRMTDQEVQAATRSRSINEEVIRIIANSREMTRSYGAKLGLIQNPKTPLPIAMRFLTALRAPDLKAVAKSKGLPQTLVNQAKKLLTNKDSGG